MAAKNRDLPPEIRDFNNVFSKLTYRYETSSVFSDYLDYCIYVFNTERNEADLQTIKDRYKSYYQHFPELFHAHVQANAKMITEPTDWYDLLGTFYEAVLSPYKASAFGQFFTPEHICDLMAMIQGADEERGAGRRVNDCA